MDTLRPQGVSVIDPIGPAIEHVRLMLFKPFDISKWMTIGFCTGSHTSAREAVVRGSIIRRTTTICL